MQYQSNQNIWAPANYSHNQVGKIRSILEETINSIGLMIDNASQDTLRRLDTYPSNSNNLDGMINFFANQTTEEIAKSELSHIQQFMDKIICSFESGSSTQVEKAYELLIRLVSNFQLKNKSFPVKGFAHFQNQQFEGLNTNLQELDLTFDDYIHIIILTINKRICNEIISNTNPMSREHICKSLMNCLFDSRLEWGTHCLSLGSNQKSKLFAELLERMFPWAVMSEIGILEILDRERASLENSFLSPVIHGGMSVHGPFISLAFSFLGVDSKYGRNAVEAFWKIAQRMFSQIMNDVNEKSRKSPTDETSLTTFSEFLGLIISKCRGSMPEVFQARIRECMEFFQKLKNSTNLKTQCLKRFLSKSGISREENPKDKAFFEAIDQEFGFCWETKEIEMYDFDADVELDLDFLEEDFDMGSAEQQA